MYRTHKCHSVLMYFLLRTALQCSAGETELRRGDNDPPVVSDGCSFSDHSFCYRFFSQHETWTDAQQVCQSWGGHLATIPNANINQRLRENDQGSAFWIGLHRTAQDVDDWYWQEFTLSVQREMGRCKVTNECTAAGYENWSSGEPRNSEKDCVEMSPGPDGMWSTAECSHGKPFVCARCLPSCAAGTEEIAGEVHCKNFALDCGEACNVAQSSTAAGREAWKAVDGMTRRVPYEGTCAETEGAAGLNWWRIDLATEREVATVKVWRGEEGGEQGPLTAAGMEIRVGNDSSVVENNPVCYKGSGEEALNAPFVEYAGCHANGRFVFLVVADAPLRVCEVEILGPGAAQGILDGAWARYKASDWDTEGQVPVLRDSSGHDRHSVASEGHIMKLRGALGRVDTLVGGADAGIWFPEDSIPSHFTICSATKYLSCPYEGGGMPLGRILESEEGDLLHGHADGYRGVASYDLGSWQVVAGASTTPSTAWLVMCGKNDAAAPTRSLLVDGKWVQRASNATAGEGGKKLTVNRGLSGARSRWAVAEVVVWDRHLIAEEMMHMSDYLHTLLHSGDNSSTLTPGTRRCDAEVGGVCWGWSGGSHLGTSPHDHLAWCDAEAYCQAWGGHLATMNSNEEDDAIIVQQTGGWGRGYWIGLHNSENAPHWPRDYRGWHWTSGSRTTYKKWRWPYHATATHECGSVGCCDPWGRSEIETVRCDSQRPFICNTRGPAHPDPECRAKEHGVCWRVFETRTSWHDAALQCASIGMHLATVESYEDNNVLFNLAKDYPATLWFGLRGTGSGDGGPAGDGWAWASGSNATLRKWSSGKPSDGAAPSEECVRTDLEGYRYRWTHAPCEDVHEFVCNKRMAPAPPAPLLKPARSCDDLGGRTVAGPGEEGKCFVLDGSEEAWNEAEKACDKRGGHLASITSSAENALVEQLRDEAALPRVWVGAAEQRAAGDLWWSDGVVSNWSNWAAEEPGGSGNCLQLTAGGEWTDEECGAALHGVCAVQTQCSWVELGQSSIKAYYSYADHDKMITPSRRHYGTYARFKVVHDAGFLSLYPSPADTWWSSPWECAPGAGSGQTCPGYADPDVPIELILDRADDAVPPNNNRNLIAYGERSLQNGYRGNYRASASMFDLDLLGHCYFADPNDDTVPTTMHVPPQEGGAPADVVCDGFHSVVVLDEQTSIWADYPSSRLAEPYAQARTGNLDYTLWGCQLVSQLACSPADALAGYRRIEVEAGACELRVDCASQELQRGSCTAAGLTSLDLSDQWIESLAAGVFDGMSQLETLDLSHNSLATLPRHAFVGTPRLKSLRIESAMLQHVAADAFAGLHELESLMLANNLLDLGALPFFSDLQALTLLDLGHNVQTRLPPHLFLGCSSLVHLQLDSNLLLAVGAGAFDGLSNLETLVLDRNRLSEVSGDAWQGLDGLRSLSLADNDIESLQRGAFQSLPALDHLDLSNNDLAALGDGTFSGLASLSWLDLSRNEITTVIAGAFEGLEQLQSLTLDINDISTFVPGAFEGLSSLKTLSLNHNALTTLEKGFFRGLSDLQTLFVIRSTVTTVREGAFEGLEALQYLHLSQSPLSTIEVGAFDGLARLLELYMTVGGPTTLTKGLFRGLASVKVLNFYRNFVQTLEKDAFAGAETTESLSFHDGGALKTLQPGCFNGLSKLTGLDIGSNVIERLEPGVFDGLGNLDNLIFLGGNPLQCLPYLPTHLVDAILLWNPGYLQLMRTLGVCLPLGCPPVAEYDYIPAFHRELADGVDSGVSLLRATERMMNMVRPDVARVIDSTLLDLGLYVARGGERCWCMGVLTCFPPEAGGDNGKSCGNGLVEAALGEECDDGNRNVSDGCPACAPARCGDGFTRAGVEECDDGNADDLDACSNACVAATCTDGILNQGEEGVDCGGLLCDACCLADSPCDDGAEHAYRGCARHTVEGYECQRWDSQSPHSHDRTPQNYPGSGLVGNYCRNPDGAPGGPWCYTTDPGVRWQYCEPDCCLADSPCTDVGRDYRGCIRHTVEGHECQRWDSQSPHSHIRTPESWPGLGLSSNYCRNPDGDPGGLWCYTTDPGVRWDWCSDPDNCEVPP